MATKKKRRTKKSVAEKTRTAIRKSGREIEAARKKRAAKRKKKKK